MADPGQTKLNEFYLLPTNSTKTPRINVSKVQTIKFDDYSTRHFVNLPTEEEIVLHTRPPFSSTILGMPVKSFDTQEILPEYMDDYRNLQIILTVHKADVFVALAKYGGGGCSGYRPKLFFVDKEKKVTLLHNAPMLSDRSFAHDQTRVGVVTQKNEVAFWSWADLLKGNLQQSSVKMANQEALTVSQINDFCFEKKGITAISITGEVMIAGSLKTTRLKSDKGMIWCCIAKTGKNRYAVSGLNQTTDPYTQVIKLVDSRLRCLSTLTFKKSYGGTKIETCIYDCLLNLQVSGPLIVAMFWKHCYLVQARNNSLHLISLPKTKDSASLNGFARAFHSVYISKKKAVILATD